MPQPPGAPLQEPEHGGESGDEPGADRSRDPSIKSNAVYALVQKYTNETQAVESIAKHLSQSYPGDTRVQKVIGEVQQIYRDNFFPEMKANWAAYPENIGHKDWQGCFRCHDDSHKSADGKKIIESSNCNACHTIIAQGRGDELMQITPKARSSNIPMARKWKAAATIAIRAGSSENHMKPITRTIKAGRTAGMGR